MLRAFSIVVLSALVVSLAWAADAVKGPAPGFALQSRDGTKVSPAQYKGDVVMINFWATWCVPCRQEMPKLEALYQRYNKLGFKLLAVNVENNPDGVKKWLAETPVSFPVLFDTKSEVSKLYKVETMPTTVIVAKDGTMRYLHHGYQAGYENDYQNEVRTLLRE
jgi:thiol-disulfide isomerase/thioredoxin